MNQQEPVQLDIESVIKRKAPVASKKIPGFLYRWVERLICQKRMNYILRKYAADDGVDFAESLLSELDVKIRVAGEENIPAEGRFTFVSNHPLGGLDGVALVAFLGKRYNGRVRFLVNDLLMYVKPLASVFLPINKHGGQAKSASAVINETYESDMQILVFPAGLVSRLQRGGICDLEWKKAFVTKTVQYQRDVIPIYFEGRNSTFFYQLERWRKRLGIRFNIGMVWLPREMFKSEHKTFTIHIGEPIPWQTFDASKTPAEWAGFVKERVYSLKRQ